MTTPAGNTPGPVSGLASGPASGLAPRLAPGQNHGPRTGHFGGRNLPALAREGWRAAALGLSALLAYRLRSFFVIAAVSLGIASLTVIVAAVDGASKKADEIADMFGPDAVLVFGGNIVNRAVGARTLTLTWEDASRIRQSLPGAYIVLPMRSKGNVRLKHESSNYDVSLVGGTTENYAKAWNWPLVEGRDLTAEDVQRGARVALMGDRPARELFGDESPVGRTFLMSGVPFTVVGLLQYRGMSGGGSSVDDRVIIPITTLTQRFNMDRRYFRALRVKFEDTAGMDAHVEDLRSLLRHLHRLAPEDPDDFTVLTAREVLKFLSVIKGGLVLFLGVTATAAMIVGGFVLANLFLLSVTERRVEIGLKKALGAPGRAILLQFLMESLALTLCGAVGGVLLGALMGQMLERLGLIEMVLSAKVFLLALAAATAVGLVFGLRPARQAAALDPIQALRGGE